MSVTFNANEHIIKWFPDFNLNAIKWSRLSTSAFNSYMDCPFKFFCVYHSGIKIPENEYMIMGKRCHKMKELYYNKFDLEKLLKLCEVSNYNINIVAEHIFKYFTKINMNQNERTAMMGFSQFEAKRVLEITNKYKGHKLRIRYIRPTNTELKIRTGIYSGVIDIIFRDYEDDTYTVNDWKDGLKAPYKKELHPGIKRQVHYYSVLLDEFVLMDNVGVFPTRIIPKRYQVTYPRYQMIFKDEFSSLLKSNVKSSTIYTLENINSHVFNMKIGEKTCRWDKKIPCDFFFPICKQIMEQDLDMLFDIPQDPIVDDIWFDF